MFNRMLTASNIRTVREFVGLHQSQLAEMLGVGQSYIAMIEGGRRPLTDGLRARMMQALDLTPEKVSAIISAQQAYEDVRQTFLN